MSPLLSDAQLGFKKFLFHHFEQVEGRADSKAASLLFLAGHLRPLNHHGNPSQGTDLFFAHFLPFCFCRIITRACGLFAWLFFCFWQVIEKEAKNFIDESFKTLRSAEAAFDMLLKFKHIRSREAINRQMMMKFNDILAQYCKEVSGRSVASVAVEARLEKCEHCCRFPIQTQRNRDFFK